MYIISYVITLLFAFYGIKYGFLAGSTGELCIDCLICLCLCVCARNIMEVCYVGEVIGTSDRIRISTLINGIISLFFSIYSLIARHHYLKSAEYIHYTLIFCFVFLYLHCIYIKDMIKSMGNYKRQKGHIIIGSTIIDFLTVVGFAISHLLLLVSDDFVTNHFLHAFAFILLLLNEIVFLAGLCISEKDQEIIFEIVYILLTITSIIFFIILSI